ncbi:lipoprotein insertase outer membrane protein LolB [Thauera sinica]|uniref:Outer-membrane lipoprotein LolB n=1 Tax=Thauera sinica TaxID=2665146 RepID=A0ABW1ATX1_9RHOO|nr:lipoprotein insertase outer membrane protein LolB [Thauera sp. K11]ATE58605.1 outer membrane lipoprotein LolB [Thauera sp. K11]
MRPVAPHAPAAARAGRRALLAAVLAAAATAACAPLAPREAAPAAQRRAVAAFELEGRMSASDGSRAASGRVEWQHGPASDTWTVYTPLGQVAARLESDAAGARLTDAGGQRIDAPRADVLLPQVLGVEVPVARLGDWVQATPAAGAEVRSRDAFGRPTQVFDQGWRIDYLDYAAPDPGAMPARLDISRGDARLRLIVDTWTPRP